MCQGCYADYGSPAIISEATQAAAKLVEAVYDEDMMGGRLHVVLDDFNIEDEHLEGLYDASNATKAERECYEAFKALTVDERASALALWEGWISSISQD